MQFSNEQNAIFNAIKNTNSNILVNAVAGSGKTTTIVEACKRLNESADNVKFLAFNKSIAEELKTRLVGLADVSTSHAFGFSILKSIYNKPRQRKYIKVDNWKYINYLKENIYSLSRIITVDDDSAKRWAFIFNVEKLFNLCRLDLVKADEYDKIADNVFKHNINRIADEIEVVSTLLENAYTMPNNLRIDFTDMIVLPLSQPDFIPTFKYVFVDEAQDLNTAQRLLMLAAARGGRFIAVGDKYQAINGFAGADADSFTKIAKEPNTIELPLSTNYRCGRAMIDLANTYVTDIHAHDGAIDGNVTRIENVTSDMFKPGDFILCRKAAPLVAMAIKLLSVGIGAAVKGLDIANDLKRLADKAYISGNGDILKGLDYEKNKLACELAAKHKVTKAKAKETYTYRNFCDSCNALENVCSHNDTDNVAKVKNYLDILFTDTCVNNAVTLSTVHKAKGLEADNVFIIEPSKLPLLFEGQKEWQVQQEYNLAYVAYTRAKKNLTFIDIDVDKISF